MASSHARRPAQDAAENGCISSLPRTNSDKPVLTGWTHTYILPKCSNGFVGESLGSDSTVMTWLGLVESPSERMTSSQRMAHDYNLLHKLHDMMEAVSHLPALLPY